MRSLKLRVNERPCACFGKTPRPWAKPAPGSWIFEPTTPLRIASLGSFESTYIALGEMQSRWKELPSRSSSLPLPQVRKRSRKDRQMASQALPHSHLSFIFLTLFSLLLLQIQSSSALSLPSRTLGLPSPPLLLPNKVVPREDVRSPHLPLSSSPKSPQSRSHPIAPNPPFPSPLVLLTHRRDSNAPPPARSSCPTPLPRTTCPAPGAPPRARGPSPRSSIPRRGCTGATPLLPVAVGPVEGGAAAAVTARARLEGRGGQGWGCWGRCVGSGSWGEM